jgi:hypothetical protein
VRVKRNFVFEGYQIAKGETGEVVSNGGNSATIVLDVLHPGLPENALFFSPPEWALTEEEAAKDALAPDRFYAARECIKAIGVTGMSIMALLTGVCGGTVIANILADGPAAVQPRLIEARDGRLYRVTVQRVHDDDDDSLDVWRVLSRVEVDPSNPDIVINANTNIAD